MFMFIFPIFLPMFMLKMYSQNDETAILKVLEKKIFIAVPANSLKSFFMDFTIQWYYLSDFLEKKWEISKFLFLPLSGILKILKRK